MLLVIFCLIVVVIRSSVSIILSGQAGQLERWRAGDGAWDGQVDEGDDALVEAEADIDGDKTEQEGECRMRRA